MGANVAAGFNFLKNTWCIFELVTKSLTEFFYRYIYYDQINILWNRCLLFDDDHDGVDDIYGCVACH